jgi:Uncharacterized protein conserved in bacteria (DUF2188)
VSDDARKPIEVRPGTRGTWDVRQGEIKRSTYPTQLEAEISGREIARSEHAEFVLKDHDGCARAIARYGPAPHDSRKGCT